MRGAFVDDLPRCPACRRDPALRVEWGCDADAARELYRITCPACNDSGRECERCEGVGTVGVLRCPASQCTPDIAAAFECYLRVEHGLLPVAGALLDQAASFVDFISIADAERGAVERERKRERELAAKHNKPKIRG